MKSCCILTMVTSVLLAGSLPSLSQHYVKTYPYTILISAHNGNAGKEFQLVITRMASRVQLRYGSLDSVRMTQFRTDPDFYHPELAGADLAIEHARLQRFNRAIQKYKVFTEDSIQLEVRSHRSLVQLLDSVYKASPDVLAQKEANRKRIVLDGTLVYVVVKPSRGVGKEVWAQSPAPDSHPLLYRLLHESLQVYRAEHVGATLPLSTTIGY
jgi:hypothetical protein